MYLRIDNGVTPPERLDDFVAFVRDTALPAVRRCRGYRSLTVSVDRAAGAVSVATAWEKEEDRDAADPAFASVLHRAGDFGLRPVRIDRFERVLSDGV